MTSNRTSLPSFFIVGAPKCGTTALYRYLAEHRDVFMPEVKEPHFFSTDLPGLPVATDFDAYLSLFAAAPSGAVTGEASASYLVSRDAVPAILAENPDARMIVCLRDPVEMAAALHAEFLYNLSEDIADFRQAWDMQEARARGIGVPPHCSEPQMLQYRSVCALGDQLERFQQRVPPGQRLVILLDDLRRDPAVEYRRVLAFLGLQHDGRERFPRVNANKVLRSRLAATLHRSLRHRLGPFYAPAKAIGNAVGIHPSRFLERYNVETQARAPLAPEFRRELTMAFAPQVAKLSRLLGRDLSHWSGQVPVGQAARL